MKIVADENELRFHNKTGVAGRALTLVLAGCTGLGLVALVATFAADPMNFLDPRREGAASVAIGVVMAVGLLAVVIAGFLFLLYSAFRPNDRIVADRRSRTISISPKSLFRRDALQYDFRDVAGFASRRVKVRGGGFDVVQLVKTDGAKTDVTAHWLNGEESAELIARLEEFIKCKKDSTN